MGCADCRSWYVRRAILACVRDARAAKRLMGATQKAKRESVLTSQELALCRESSVFANSVDSTATEGLRVFVRVGLV